MRFIIALLSLISVHLVLAQQPEDSLKTQIKKLSVLLEADSLNDSARYLRAKTYFQQDKQYAAMEDYRFLVENDSSYFYAFYKHDSLVYLDNPQLIVEDSSKAIILKPNLSHYFSVPAYDAVADGDYEQAIQLSEKALLLDSGNYDANEYRSYANFFLGNYELSIPDFERVLEEDSTYTFANHNLASALSNSGNYEAAIPYYLYVLQLDSNFSTIHFNLGNTYYYLKKYDSALYFLNQAVARDSLNPNCINARGNVYLNLGKYDSALADYSKARNIDPTDARYLDNIGLAYYYLEAYEKALQCLDSSITMDSDTYYHFYDTRAHVYHELGRYQDANEDYFKSQKLGSPIQVNGSIGWNYYCLKDYENCIRYSKITVEEDPEAWYAHYNIALSYLCLHELETSFQLYKELEDKASSSAKKGAKKDLKTLKKENKSLKKPIKKIVRKYL